MVSSSHKVLAAAILLLVGLTSLAHAQSGATTGSISGKITFKGKPAAGVFVTAVNSENDDGNSHNQLHGKSDEDGNYRITNVRAGNYHVYPVPAALVIEKGPGKQDVLVNQGENVANVDFALVQGGVITGKITGADGQPLIEEPVNIIPVNMEFIDWRPDAAGIKTDDRGIYRAFGLRQGQYRVSVGFGFSMHARQIHQQMFYPSTTDPEKATILDVTPSSELRNIDIVTDPPLPTFKIAGRVIDGESGKTLSNVLIGVVRTDGNSSVSVTGAISTNKDGNFEIENVTPGKYSISAVPFETSDWRSDSFGLDVVDRDVTGLEIKTKRAASLSGVVVLQNYDAGSGNPKPSALQMFLLMKIRGTDHRGLSYSNGSSVQVQPDGTFKASGLMPGTVEVDLMFTNNAESRRFQVVRIEQNGVPLTGGITIRDGEQVEGIRVIVKRNSYTGGIRGQVKLENGELPPTAVAVVQLMPPEKNPDSHFYPPALRVDSRGRFMVDGLEPGPYEIVATVYEPGERHEYEVARQQVTVGDSMSEVTLVVKPKQ